VRETLQTFRYTYDFDSRKYWERGMRYSRILDNKREKWQNKEEERLNHVLN
jgi:hypothetical protein